MTAKLSAFFGRAPAFWYQPPGLVARSLEPLGRLYGKTTARRLASEPPKPAGIPVICIGNATAGGTGKTPTAIAIGKACLARWPKRPIGFLTRGYGGRQKGPVLVAPARDRALDVGDEALLLAGLGPTVVAHDRYAGALLAREAGVDILIMDDGFQNPQPRKDFSLLVVDGTLGFGNGACIPAGPLREPAEAALARADGILVAGEGMPASLGDLVDSSVLWRGRMQLDRHQRDGLATSGAKYAAFAGIGTPKKFFQALQTAKLPIVDTKLFPDHYIYGERDMQALTDWAAACQASLLTTRKDWVRLPVSAKPHVEVIDAAMEIDDLHSLIDAIARKIEPRRAPS